MPLLKKKVNMMKRKKMRKEKNDLIYFVKFNYTLSKEFKILKFKII